MKELCCLKIFVYECSFYFNRGIRGEAATHQPENDDTLRNSSNSFSTLWTFTPVILGITVLFGGVMLSVSIVWYRRQRTPDSSADYSRVQNKIQNTFNTYNNCKIQVGDTCVMTVQASSDEDNESVISH